MYGQASRAGSERASAMMSGSSSAQSSRRPSFGSWRPSMSHKNSGLGHHGGPGPSDIEFESVVQGGDEPTYPTWWTRKLLIQKIYNLCEDSVWNSFISVMVLLGILWVAVGLKHTIFFILDIAYNVCYAVHVFGVAYNTVMNIEGQGITIWKSIAFLLDMFTFSYYVSRESNFKLLCYYLRLHRPFSYLWSLNENLKGSVLVNSLKFCYIFLVMRVTWALVWLNMDALEELYRNATKLRPPPQRALEIIRSVSLLDVALDEDENDSAIKFLSACYLINKIFVPIGPSVPPANDIERIVFLFIMLSGCLVLTAYAVASLSLVISLYMRPEESFRERYRLIIEEMEGSHIPKCEQERVKTFYRMYWLKQGAVSETCLLPTFPPTLPATIFTDIYFEAVQKSKILRDLSYQFISEMAKKMETIHYIPGDSIIKRSEQKSSYKYITYGDIELVTAEDDITAILRLTRGTMLTPGGVCAAGAAHLEVRAATFCTAHVLAGTDLWRVVLKHGRTAVETFMILSTYNEHLERVKIHHQDKGVEKALHKSSILHFKRCLMALKEAKDAHGQFFLANTDILLEIAGCYIMRNRADATLTEESDAICLRPTFPCILQPTSSLLSAWNMFVAVLIVAVCFVHPYYLVFKAAVPIEFRFFDYIVTGVYVLDLIAHLSTGAHVEEGVPITFRQTSLHQMRCHWFVLDVLGTVPMFEFIGDGHFAGLNKILRIPKVFRVLKEVEDSLVYHGNVLRFLTYTLLMLIACYLVAALQQGFMCFKFRVCHVMNLTHAPFWAAEPIDDRNIINRISFGLYWAVSMIMFTSHKESGAASGWDDMLYTMVLLEICILLRLFMEAVYSATILVTTSLREDYDAKITIVKNFLIRNHVDPILRQRFIDYLQLCWFTDKAYSLTNKRSIFYDLPSHVYQNIVTRQRSRYILSLPFMKYVREQDLKEISASATLFYSSPNEVILNTGDISNEIYIIKRGFCEIVSPDTKRCIGLLHVRSYFGVLVCLLRLPTYYTIRAVTHVQLFSISRKQLLKAIEKVPQVTDAINYVKGLPEYQRLKLRHQKPFLQYKVPDDIPNLARFPLRRKHEPDTDFLMPFYRLGFLSILRYIFPRYTIRPDGKYLIHYEWFRAFCAFASAVVFPSYTYLVLQWSWLWHITMLLDLCAYYDIFQRMLVGYYNEMGILVFHPSRTAAYYIKGAFFTDLLACLPLENLESLHYDPGIGTRITFMKQFLMMNRLIQLYRLPSALTILKNIIERRDIIIVSEFFPLFIVWLTVLTSFIIGNSVQIYQQGEEQWLILPYEDPGGSWVSLFGKTFRFNITASPWNLHLASYFWVTFEVSTTGYNTINPSHWKLILVLFLGMLMGGMIITYYSVKIISMRAKVNKSLAKFQAHLKDIAIFMKRECLDPELQKVVLEYYEYSWDKMGGVNYRNIFKLCDLINLRTDAILHIYGPTFTRCPILSHMDISLMRIVGRAVNSAYFLRGMNIIANDDVIAHMYFVDYGGVNATEIEGDETNVVKLPRGSEIPLVVSLSTSVFGNLDGEPFVRCFVSFEATSRAHLLMIKSEIFHQIIVDFPAVQLLMKKFRTKKSYITGDAADTYAAAQKRSQASSPMIVSSRKGLMYYLFLNDKYIQIYLIIVSLLCVYIDEYNFGFQDNSTSLIIALYVLDVCFLMKILLNYMLPTIAVSANIRKILIPLRATYLRGEFKYDLLSCFPFELIALGLHIEESTKWMLFSVFRLNRILRIVTVYESIKRYHERITVNLIITTTFSAFTWFALFVHTTACLWYFIGNFIDERNPRSSWIYKDDKSSWCENRYICSLYFVLTTFTQNGVGDIMPKHHVEVMFVIIFQIISTMLYMIYVGEFSNVIQNQSFRSFSFYSKYMELQEFMVNNRVSKNLVTLVQQYGLHLWRETRGMQAPHFLLTAPQSMKLQIMSACYMHHLTRHHVFELCEPAFLRQLVGYLQLLTYNEDMYVVKSSEITDSMYLIHTGKIEEIAEEKHKVPRIYPAGSYFGVLQGLVQGVPFTHSYRTFIKSQVLTLRLDDWKYLLDHYPFTKEAIRSYMSPIDGKRDNGSPKPKPPRPPKPPPKPKPPFVTQEKNFTSANPSAPTNSKPSGAISPASQNVSTIIKPEPIVKNADRLKKIKKKLSIVLNDQSLVYKNESNKSVQHQEKELVNTLLLHEKEDSEKQLHDNNTNMDMVNYPEMQRKIRPDLLNLEKKEIADLITKQQIDNEDLTVFQDNFVTSSQIDYYDNSKNVDENYVSDKDRYLDNTDDNKASTKKMHNNESMLLKTEDAVALSRIPGADDIMNTEESDATELTHAQEIATSSKPLTNENDADTLILAEEIATFSKSLTKSDTADLTRAQEMATSTKSLTQAKDSVDLYRNKVTVATNRSPTAKDVTATVSTEERYISDLIYADEKDVNNVAHINYINFSEMNQTKEKKNANITFNQESDKSVVKSPLMLDTEKQILEHHTQRSQDSHTPDLGKSEDADTQNLVEADIRRKQHSVHSLKAQPSDLKHIERTEFIEKQILSQLLYSSNNSVNSEQHQSEQHMVTVDMITSPTIHNVKRRASVDENYTATHILPYLSISLDQSNSAQTLESSSRETYKHAPDKSIMYLHAAVSHAEPKKNTNDEDMMTEFDEPTMMNDAEKMSLAETRDQDTSTTKINRRLIRVRYKGERSKSQPKVSTDLHTFPN